MKNQLKKIKCDQEKNNSDYEIFIGSDDCDENTKGNPTYRSFNQIFDKDWKLLDEENKIEDVKFVFLTTYSNSIDFLSKWLNKNIPTVLLADCGNDLHENKISIEENYLHLLKILPRKHFRAFEIFSAFHPKLFIVCFDDRIRIIIGNGNLLMQDWTFWDNAFWTRDYFNFSFNKNLTENELNTDYKFSNELSKFMGFILDNNINQVKSLISNDLLNLSFIEKDVSLIMSLPGLWSEDSYMQMSTYKLSNILKNHKEISISFEKSFFNFITSSMGFINRKFLLDFISSFLSLSSDNISKEVYQLILKNFKVYYPSEQFVLNSRFGIKNASCLFFKRYNYENCKFISQILRQYEHKAPGDLNSRIPHYKLMLVNFENNEINDNSLIYLGSHNLTTAAWGRIEKSNNQLMIYNYELGIIIPPKKDSSISKQKIFNDLGVVLGDKLFTRSDTPYLSSDFK